MSRTKRFMDNLEEWAAYWRSNPHRFITDYLGLKLYDFQKVIVYQMFNYPNFILVCSRGLAKSTTALIFSLGYCVLYPGTIIVVVAPTKGQSTRFVKKVYDLKRGRPNLDNEIEDIKTGVNESSISFYNGSCAVIISQDRPGSSNSLTLSWLLIDEAKFIDYNRLKDETLPANGGIKSYFGKHSCNHSIMILSDMPQTQKGSWFLHYKEKMDVEVIAAIEGLIFDIWRLKERIRRIKAQEGKPPKALIYQLRHKDRQLNQLRSVATYYREYSSIENLQLLGENYIRQMKRDLTPLTFQTSILCQRIGIAKDGFYSSMREKHKYDASDMEFLDSVAENFYDINSDVSTALDARADKDINTLAPICIGMDYNANINWIVAAQPSGRRLNILKSFYVKFERKIPALIDDFCQYYAFHQNKTVIFYYDTTALGSNYAVNEQDFRWVVIHEFERHGWNVIDIYIGNPMRHDEKYLLINQGFAGKQRLMPFFNRQNNDDLILAIQAAGVTRG